jgi:hypothetical protein
MIHINRKPEASVCLQMWNEEGKVRNFNRINAVMY